MTDTDKHILSLIAIMSLITYPCIAVIENVEWIAPSFPLLPHPDQEIAAFYYDKIYLFGGLLHQKHWVEYNIKSDKMTEFGDNALPNNTYGNAQYYTQINHIFYWIVPTNANHTIMGYNIITNETQYIPLNLHSNAYGTDVCLASTDELLFVLGDSWASNQFQIYNVSTHQWLSGPSMAIGRAASSCIVDSIRAVLYVIGGNSRSGPTEAYNSYETMNIENINHGTWVLYSNALIYPTALSRALIHEDHIFIIGGQNVDGFITEIQIIHCETGNVSSGGYLIYPIIHTAAVLAGDKIYAFGGGSNGGATDRWQYLNLRTSPDKQDYSLLKYTMLILGGLTIFGVIGCILYLWKKRTLTEIEERELLLSSIIQK
eukprot:201000_1